jgi:hypothetical protein
MRISFLMISFFLIAHTSVAQIVPARSKHYAKFFKSTTYVVEDEAPFSSFNAALKEAMERHWTITPFKIISYKEFEKMRTNEDASFMILGDVKQKNLSEMYEFINFVLGDKKRDFESMPDLASVPLATRDADEENYLYKMGAFVKFMQTSARENAASPGMRLADYKNVNDKRLASMELWLLETELASEINTLEKLKQHYGHAVKLVTREQIAEAIASDRKDVAFLHKIGPESRSRVARGKCWKFIVAAEDGRVLYSSHHDIDRQNPDALLVSDLKKIGR